MVWLWLCVALVVQVSSGEECLETGGCVCTKSDGSSIDLTEAEPHTFYRATKLNQRNASYFEVDVFVFHPCRDVPFVFNDSAPVNDCKTASICRRTVKVLQVGNSSNVIDTGYAFAGTAVTATWAKSPLGSATISYVSSMRVSVNLVCTESSLNNLVITDSASADAILTFYSRKACFTNTSSHRSLGTTLLIILFVLTLTYLLVGCAVKHFLMGARGIEIIPNHTFWLELPSLVKDGITFIQNGFKPPVPAPSTPGQNPNPNSYDSI